MIKKGKRPDASLLLFKFFVVSLFFNSSPGLTSAHSSYSSCSTERVSLFRWTEPEQQECGLCVTSWEAVRAAFWIPGSSARLPSAASGTEGELPWGACAAGPALHLGGLGRGGTSVSTQKSQEYFPGHFLKLRVLFSSWEVWLGGLNPTWTYPLHTAEGIPLTF